MLWCLKVLYESSGSYIKAFPHSEASGLNATLENAVETDDFELNLYVLAFDPDDLEDCYAGYCNV